MRARSNVDYAGAWADLDTVCRYLDETLEAVAHWAGELKLLGSASSDGSMYFPVRQFSGARWLMVSRKSSAF